MLLSPGQIGSSADLAVKRELKLELENADSNAEAVTCDRSLMKRPTIATLIVNTLNLSQAHRRLDRKCTRLEQSESITDCGTYKLFAGVLESRVLGPTAKSACSIRIVCIPMPVLHSNQGDPSAVAQRTPVDRNLIKSLHFHIRNLTLTAFNRVSSGMAWNEQLP